MSLWHPDTYRLSVTLLASIIQGQALSVQQELARVKLTESQSLLGDCCSVSFLARRPNIHLALTDKEVNNICVSRSYCNFKKSMSNRINTLFQERQ